MYGMPSAWGALPCLINRVGGTRDTHYGSSFKVESKVNPSNLAYTSSSLNLHSDLPFYEKFDVAQFLHCLQQSGTGGENEFADSFQAEKIMKEDYHEEWKLLGQTQFEFADNGHDDYGGFSKLLHRSLFKYDFFCIK